MKLQVLHRSNKFGIAMAEYVLIGSTVLVLCLLAVMGVGKNLQDWLLGLKGDLAQHAKQAQIAQTEIAQGAGTPDIDPNNNTPVNLGSIHVSPSNPNALCGQDFCVSAPGLTGVSVATAGSNGNTSITDSAANIYTQLAQLMTAKGVDPSSVGLLTQMASLGHNIAFQQSLLRNQHNALVDSRNSAISTSLNTPDMSVSAASTALSSYCAGLSSTCTTLSSSDASLGSPSVAPSTSGTTLDPNSPTYYRVMLREILRMRKQLSNFDQLSQQLNTSINNYPEETRPLLTGAADVILKVGNSYKYGVYTNQDTGNKMLRFTANTQNIQIIHTNSNTICDNGGDQSQCHWNNQKKAINNQNTTDNQNAAGKSPAKRVSSR